MKCEKHKRYKGKSWPKSECIDCIEIFFIEKGIKKHQIDKYKNIIESTSENWDYGQEQYQRGYDEGYDSGYEYGRDYYQDYYRDCCE